MEEEKEAREDSIICVKDARRTVVTLKSRRGVMRGGLTVRPSYRSLLESCMSRPSNEVSTTELPKQPSVSKLETDRIHTVDALTPTDDQIVFLKLHMC